MKSNGLKFEEETVATPAEITFCNNKIWSGNAGRTANCLMVGDIRAIKKTVTIKWYHLTGEQTAQINKYISNVDSPFFNATLLDETFNEIKIRVYAGDKFTSINEAVAGTVCAVTGLSAVSYTHLTLPTTPYV